MGKKSLFMLLAGALAMGGCAKPRQGDAPSQSADAARASEPPRPDADPGKSVMLTLKSTAFGHQGEIPKKYACQGEDISPPLAWTGVPPEARSLALIVDDPDAPDPAAPKRVWVHWVAFNLPPSVGGLGEGVKALPEGARSGQNDWNRPGYGGPCPPIGRHRYFFKLYALDQMLALEQPSKAQLEKAMKGHILASAELVGTYQKS